MAAEGMASSGGEHACMSMDVDGEATTTDIMFVSPRKGAEECGDDVHVDISMVGDVVFRHIAKRKQLSDEDLRHLNLLFKTSTLFAALSLVEKAMVKKCVSPNGRSLFLVEGSRPEPYVCFPRFCSCPYFSMNVISKSDALACKHVLAARIADAIGRAELKNVSKEDFAKWLLKEEAQPSPAKRWRQRPQ